MKKNEILTLDVIDTGNNGEGIAKQDEFVIFIPFALCGEKIKAHILKVNKNIVFAKLVQVITPSPLREKALCPYFTKCGGCEIQHIKYNEQLKIKTNIVKNALKKYAGIDTVVNNCIASKNVYNYRNKMQFPCSINGIGMYAKHSHNLINIDSCPLSKPLCDKAYKIFKSFVLGYNQSFYNEQNHSGVIRHILFREISGNIAICIVINGTKINNEKELIDLYKQEFKENFSLYYNINTKKTNSILSDKTICIYGKEELMQNNFGVTYFISPNSFMQINDDIQNAIYDKVLQIIDKDNIVINAYSGAGLLSAILAQKSAFVYGVEIDDYASKNADRLKEINKISNMQNICGNCVVELPKLIRKLQQNSKTSLVLDPPRKGCEENILKAILASEIKEIIYISCNPATFARDAKILSEKYDLIFTQPYDMFPQTRHVETFAIFKLKQGV